MSNKLLRRGNTYMAPAVPAQPAVPAYTWYETETVTPMTIKTTYSATGWVTVPVTQLVGGKVEVIGYEVRYIGTGSGYVTTTTQAVTRTVAHYVPAKAAVPGSGAQRVDFPPMGWTSFAHSIKSIATAGEANYYVRGDATGVVVGLSTVRNPPPGYCHIAHGLLFSNGLVRNLRTGVNYGAYGDASKVNMELKGGIVRYTVGGTQVGSEAGTYAVGERLFLAAALYGVGDSVDNPELLDINEGSSTAALAPLAAFSADAESGSSLAVLAPLTADSRMLDTSTATLPRLTAFSADAAGGSSSAKLTPLTANSYGDTLDVTVGVESYAQLAPLNAASLLLVGQTSTDSDVPLAPLWALSADHEYAESRAVMAGLTALSYDLPAGTPAFMLDIVAFDVPMSEYSLDKVAARDVFAFDVPMSASQAAGADMRDAFTFDVALEFIGEETVDARDVFWFAAPLEVPGGDLEVWAINLDSMGSTSYSGYPFNSFARIGDRYYGAGDAGISELSGATDNGAPIRASIDFGQRDFGTATKKTVEQCFLGM
ncbi:MAG: hypothetical protein ABI040_01715, partial [Rhodoferax sp.]